MADEVEKDILVDSDEEEDLPLQDASLDFDEDELLTDDDDEDVVPSVLYKGVSKPKNEDDWRQLLLEADPQGVPEYRISSVYNEGDLVLHPKFGLGVVTKVLTPTKMEMVFDTSKKLMAMGITPPGEDESSA